VKHFIILLLTLLNGLHLDASVTIRIEASFGSKKKDCRGGVGLCSARTTRIENPGSKVATLSLSQDERSLTLVVSRATLDDCDGQISQGQFIQDEDYPLPSEIKGIGGISGLLSIPAGSYPTIITAEQITVTIVVSDSPVGIK